MPNGPQPMSIDMPTMAFLGHVPHSFDGGGTALRRPTYLRRVQSTLGFLAPQVPRYHTAIHLL